MAFGGPGRDSDGDAADAGHLRCSGAAGIAQSMGDEGTVITQEQEQSRVNGMVEMLQMTGRSRKEARARS